MFVVLFLLLSYTNVAYSICCLAPFSCHLIIFPGNHSAFFHKYLLRVTLSVLCLSPSFALFFCHEGLWHWVGNGTSDIIIGNLKIIVIGFFVVSKVCIIYGCICSPCRFYDFFSGR